MIITPLSQRDPRWADKPLGFTSNTIGNYGCTLTCLTMMLMSVLKLTITPDQLNEQLKANGGFSDGQHIGQGDLIVWAAITKMYPAIKFKYRHDGYQNFPVWLSVINNFPVCVQVNAAKIGARQHWCLYIGSQHMVDPWTGVIVPTSTYPALGYALFSK